MQSKNSAVATRVPGQAAVRRELQSILQSTTFAHSERLRNFLRFTVESTIDNRGCNLKEYTIGLEVYGKDSSFDPRIDPIVRVDACRLRKKLLEYYSKEGSNDALVIHLRTGTYVPEFNAAPDIDSDVAPPVSMNVGAAPCTVRPSSGADNPTGRRSAVLIAVLPFTNMSPDRNDECLCDGLTEELINGVARLENVRVIPRTVVWAFKNKTINIRELGASLNANLILEGSVRKSGDVYRICARLCDSSNVYELWSQTYSARSTDAFAMQDNIAHAVTTAIRANLSVAEPNDNAPRESGFSHLSDLKDEALYVRDNASISRAFNYFREVLSHDSYCVEAYSGLADACLSGTAYGAVSPTQMRRVAREAALRGVRAKWAVAEPHLLLGIVCSEFDHKIDAACREYEKVLQLKPECPRAHYWYSRTLSVNGRLEDAIDIAKHGVNSNPRSPISNISMGNLLYIRKDFSRAAECYSQAVEIDPTLVYSHLRLSLACAAQQRGSEAIAHANRGLDVSGPTPLAIAVAGYAHGVASSKMEAVALLERLESASNSVYVPGRYIALVYLGLGETAEAIRYLRMESREPYPQLGFVKIGTFAHHLNRHQEFRAFLKNSNRPRTCVTRRV